MADQEGAFFAPDELLALFPRLKHDEAVMGKKERAVLVKIEKILYGRFSISELENCLKSYREASR
jgi:hypothetical protein